LKNVQKIDLGLTGYDELFANDEERKVNKLPRIFDIPISEIDDFPDHPFKVKIDEDIWIQAVVLFLQRYPKKLLPRSV
jgi:ParB family chromosome partitioning protein